MSLRTIRGAKNRVAWLNRVVFGKERAELPKIVITEMDPPEPRGGCWVIGKMERYYFHACVFPEHALQPSYELGRSRISKLWVFRAYDDQVVVAFDRGWEMRPTTPTTQTMVDVLTATLAERIYHY